jgi:IS1 family transposase/transposase-like protein
MITCKNCQNTHTVKNGFVRGKQRYKCQACGYNFVLGDARHSHATEIKKALAIILYSLGKSSFGFLGKLFGVSRTTTYSWIRQAASRIDTPPIASDIQEIEFDEIWYFIQSTKEKSGLLKAVDRGTGRTIAWVLGGRHAATFQRLYDKLKHLTDCVFYTDNWDAFAQVLPKERHIIGKAHTHAIERDNSHTRHYLARMTRRTKVVSKSEAMIDASLKLWCALTVPAIFAHYQALFLSIFN